jgi:hypothetical protein
MHRPNILSARVWLFLGTYLLSTGYSNSDLMERLGPTAFQEINRLEDEYLDTVLVTQTVRKKHNV